MTAFLIFFLLFGTLSPATVSDFLLNQTNYPGYIPLTGFDMFYWLFPSKSGYADTDPLIVWFEGGPGCSDMMGMFYENGPYRIKHTGSTIQLQLNQYSWTNFANMLFVDQPKGTGLSISQTFNEDETSVATGCSYAGQMLPYIAQYLYDHKTNDINFQQIALGDAFVKYVDFVKTYPKYALDNKLINESVYTQSMINVTLCEKMIANNSEELQTLGVCSSVYGLIAGTTDNPKFDVFDIRLNCTYPPWCYDFSGATEFINMPMIQDYLNASKRIANWVICNGTVKEQLAYHSMLTDKSQNISYLLSKNIQILQYSGIYDFIVDYYGTEDWISEMNWTYQSQWNQLGYSDLIVPINGTNKVIGKTKSYGNLTYQIVNDAGHLAILSQPQYFYQTTKQTYFGEYYECSAYDACNSYFKTCQNDKICSYQMYANPCVGECNIDYQKYFSQMRTYNTTYNDSEGISVFPNYCNFKDCTASWLNKINNTNLTNFHQCAIKNCTNYYQNYTYIAHKYAQLNSCNSLFATCSQDDVCASLLINANSCLQTNRFSQNNYYMFLDLIIDPTVYPKEYFSTNFNNYWPKLSACYPTNPNANFTLLQKCVQSVWQ